MNERHTVIRSLHDVGAALWLGGSLMGAVGLNGASRAVSNPDERAHIASVGWAKWAPVSAAAIGAHLIGGLLVERSGTPPDRSSGPAASVGDDREGGHCAGGGEHRYGFRAYRTADLGGRGVSGGDQGGRGLAGALRAGVP